MHLASWPESLLQSWDSLLVEVFRERRRVPKQCELALPCFEQISTQIGVRRILRERTPRIVDSLIDDGKILLDHLDRCRIQFPASALERALQIGYRGVVLGVVEAGRHDVSTFRTNLKVRTASRRAVGGKSHRGQSR